MSWEPLLKTRGPATSTRRLDHILRVSKDIVHDVVAEFRAVAPQVSTPVLLQPPRPLHAAATHLRTTAASSRKVTWPRSKVSTKRLLSLEPRTIAPGRRHHAVSSGAAGILNAATVRQGVYVVIRALEDPVRPVRPCRPGQQVPPHVVPWVQDHDLPDSDGYPVLCLVERASGHPHRHRPGSDVFRRQVDTTRRCVLLQPASLGLRPLWRYHVGSEGSL